MIENITVTSQPVRFLGAFLTITIKDPSASINPVRNQGFKLYLLFKDRSSFFSSKGRQDEE